MQKNNYKKILGVMMLVGVFFFVGGLGRQAHAQSSPAAQGARAAVNSIPIVGPLVNAASNASDLLDLSIGFTAAIMKAIAWGFGFFNIVITWIAKVLFELAGFLITLGLQLNASVMTNQVVTAGWAIARNLSNLAIVFGLIFIAFATILRIDSWGAKKLLGDLIIVALLINFSLLIPGIFIDASGVVTNFFTQKVTGADISRISEVIASATTISKLEQASVADLFGSNSTMIADELSQGTIDRIVQMFLMALFTYFAAIVLGNVAYIIFKRFFVLLGLLVMAPLASTAYIFPNTKKYFSEWWNTLIQQSISLPVIMFFMYLAVSTAIGTAGGTDYFANLSKSAAETFGGSFIYLFTQIGKMVIILGLLKLSLIAGEKMGEKGASAGLGMMKSAQTFALGALAGGAGATAGWIPRKILAGGKMEKDGVVSTRGERLSGALSRIGLVGVAGGIDKLSARGPEQISAYQNQYANMSDAMFKGLVESGQYARTAPLWEYDIESAARVQELAKRTGVLKELGKTENGRAILKDLAERSKSFGVSKQIYKIRPDLGGLEDKKRFVAGLSPKAIDDLESDLLLDPIINAGLERRHVEAIAASSTDKQNKFLKGMEARLENIEKSKGEEREWLERDLAIDLDYISNNPALQNKIKGLNLTRLNEKLAQTNKEGAPKPNAESTTPIAKQTPAVAPAAPAEKPKTPETPKEPIKKEESKPASPPPPKEKGVAEIKAENIKRAQDALKSTINEVEELEKDIQGGKLSEGARKEAESKLKEAQNVVMRLKKSLEENK